jgi:4-amino-4-deoxy-L-arabinose transferase-like glycosyltransferase
MILAAAMTLCCALSFTLLPRWGDSPDLGWSWLGLWFVLTGAAVLCLGSFGHLWG